MFPKTIDLALLSVIIFTVRSLPSPTSTGARGVHKWLQGISIHITESKIHNSYLKNHDSTLMLSSVIFTYHPFQPSSILLLRVGNTFSISSPFGVTKLQKIVLMSHRLAAFHCQCSWTRIFLSLTNPVVMGTQLGFKRH